MEVYNGPHLMMNYEKENSRLIISWKSSPDNDLVYREELIEHLNIVLKIKPSQIIWLLDNLTFKVTDVTKKWVEENISQPVFRAGFVAINKDGFDQVAFVVGKDVLAYIDVMDIFKKNTISGFRPKYFATQTESEIWLNEEVGSKFSNEENESLSISFKGVDNNGKIVFEFKEIASKFDSTINYFKNISEENHFMRNNIAKYSSLTKREKETLRLIIKAYTNPQIADKMSVSENTIRTHRNRIWNKLEIHHFRDCLRFECFFN
jgi:DNA-binding CsgD family transcriptional regulator|tara:strand:+ start:524 stop:1312 length:789 start_codon:yes stop_codon:yes gene_type:complete